MRLIPLTCLAIAAASALNRPVTIRRVKRLSRDEEIKLAHIAQLASRHKAARDELAAEQGRPPTAEEWARRVKEHRSALARAQRDGRRARAALVAANGGLAVAVARAYANPPFATADDLAQEAYLGLARAAERFDGTRGVRFSTYATPWVRAACSAWLRRTAYSTRVPDRVAALAARARRASTRLEAAGGVLCGNQNSGAPRHRRDVVSVTVSARWRGGSRRKSLAITYFTGWFPHRRRRAVGRRHRPRGEFFRRVRQRGACGGRAVDGGRTGRPRDR